MTNTQLNSDVDAKVTTNANNENTGARVNAGLKSIIKRLPETYDVTLIVGETAVPHNLGEIPYGVSMWEEVGGPDTKVILLSNYEVYTKDADKTLTIYIYSPDAKSVKVKIW